MHVDGQFTGLEVDFVRRAGEAGQGGQQGTGGGESEQGFHGLPPLFDGFPVDCENAGKVQEAAPIGGETGVIVSLELGWKGPVT
ncbi:hypothetical protein GCM10017624_01540 [Azotobacter vinelandii]|nr:hypothetical protein GCM10017624_01540 [Azotobacter vinelandii]